MFSRRTFSHYWPNVAELRPACARLGLPRRTSVEFLRSSMVIGGVRSFATRVERKAEPSPALHSRSFHLDEFARRSSAFRLVSRLATRSGWWCRG
jgi:hypothetical protein